jgi:WD40 repeat protein
MFVWQAHEGAVTSLAFGPAGRFLVSAGADERVKVWEPFTGAEQLRVPVGPRIVPAPSLLRWLAVSASGALAAVAYRGLTLIDLASGDVPLAQWLPSVLALKPAPDGESLFALNRDLPGELSVNQVPFTNGGTMYSLSVSNWREKRALGISPDGSRVAVGHSVYHWPPTAPYPRFGDVRLKDNVPEDLAFSADMQHLFALVGGKVMVFSLETASLKTKLKGHCGRITAMALTPDGRRLWTASHDATVKCWDTFALTLDRTYTFQTGGLDCLAVSPDGNVAAVGSGQKGTITLWDLS